MFSIINYSKRVFVCWECHFTAWLACQGDCFTVSWKSLVETCKSASLIGRVFLLHNFPCYLQKGDCFNGRQADGAFPPHPRLLELFHEAGLFWVSKRRYLDRSLADVLLYTGNPWGFGIWDMKPAVGWSGVSPGHSLKARKVPKVRSTIQQQLQVSEHRELESGKAGWPDQDLLNSDAQVHESTLELDAPANGSTFHFSVTPRLRSYEVLAPFPTQNAA